MPEDILGEDEEVIQDGNLDDEQGKELEEARQKIADLERQAKERELSDREARLRFKESIYQKMESGELSIPMGNAILKQDIDELAGVFKADLTAGVDAEVNARLLGEDSTLKRMTPAMRANLDMKSVSKAKESDITEQMVKGLEDE